MAYQPIGLGTTDNDGTGDSAKTAGDKINDNFVEMYAATNGALGKFDATAAPTANDDAANTSTNGVFAVGSRWHDVTNDDTYECVDATATAAVWVQTNNVAGSGQPFEYQATRSMTATGNITSTDIGDLVECSGTFTATLVETSFTDGQFVDILNIGTGTITVSAGTNGINRAGNDSFTLEQDEQVRVTYSSGTDPMWRAAIPNTLTGTSGQMIVLDGSAVPAYVDISGDVTVSNTGVTTIGAGKVTISMLDDTTTPNIQAIEGVALTSGNSLIANGSSWIALKHNLAGTVAPTANEDSVDGYAVGSNWYDTTNDKAYVCLDATAAAAVWTETTAGAAGGITAVLDDTAPQLGGMLDVNGQAIGDGTLELLTFTETALAENNVNITNAIGGQAPLIEAVGSTDANIDLKLDGKGTGIVNVVDRLEIGPASSAVDGNADDLVIQRTGPSGISIMSGAAQIGSIFFGDTGGSGPGRIRYNHTDNSMSLYTNGANLAVSISSTQQWDFDGNAIQNYAIETDTTPADSAGTTTLTYSNGPDFEWTLTVNTTLAFADWPPAGTLGKITCNITQHATTPVTVSLPAGIKWPSGTAWTMSSTAAQIDEVIFWTRDGGTTVYGAIVGQNMS